MIRVFNGGLGISQQSKETLPHCTNCIEIFSITRRIHRVALASKYPKSEHHGAQEMSAMSVAAIEEPAINTMVPDPRGNLFKSCKVHT